MSKRDLERLHAGLLNVAPLPDVEPRAAMTLFASAKITS
jgi:hypothetical protein